ncbi:MAG: thioredoxin-disulfide reductase [Candidatus Woykebacteria bacterium]
MSKNTYDVIVIGSGPAGLTAAIYASRGNLKILVIAGVEAGGQLMLTTDVEDFPGFPDVIQGPELMTRMRKQAERLGAEIINVNVIKSDLSNRPFKVYTPTEIFLAKTLILSTGASAKWLGIPSEQKLIGKGVSSCAVCDAPFFKDKKIAVVGGGDSAMREALFLTKFGREVHVIHRRDELRAFPALQDRAFANKKIKFIWNSEVIEVLGDTKVEGVILKNIRTNKTSKMGFDGLFVAIGHKPNTEFLKGQIDLDEKGYVVLKDHSKTSVPGVFAAGDVHDWHYQQAVTAAGAGCIAAMDAEEMLEEEKAKEKTAVKIAK